jgi:micrococcal nuclease
MGRWISLALLALLLLACSGEPAREVAPSPTHTVTSELPRYRARVVRVIDGDTIEIEGGQRVRYIGINTPELNDSRASMRAWAQRAKRVNQQLVGGKTVFLERDISETDRYGRLLRYVYVGDTMVNAELVRLGYAYATSYPPDVKYQDLLRELEREAREAGRGLWGSDKTR